MRKRAVIDVRKNIAYISQDVFLFSDSIKNNLTLGNKDISMKDIESACRLSKADEFIRKMPMGYDTLIKDCDRIFVLDNGEIVEWGNHGELIKKNGLYKRFCSENM